MPDSTQTQTPLTPATVLSNTGATTGPVVSTNPTRAVVTIKSVLGALGGALLATVGALVPHIAAGVQEAFIGAGGGVALGSLGTGILGHVRLAEAEIEHAIQGAVGRVVDSPVVQGVEKDLGVTPITQQEVDARAEAVAIDVVEKVFPGYDVKTIIQGKKGTTPQQ